MNKLEAIIAGMICLVTGCADQSETHTQTTTIQKSVPVRKYNVQPGQNLRNLFYAEEGSEAFDEIGSSDVSLKKQGIEAEYFAGAIMKCFNRTNRLYANTTIRFPDFNEDGKIEGQKGDSVGVATFRAELTERFKKENNEGYIQTDSEFTKEIWRNGNVCYTQNKNAEPTPFQPSL